MRRHACATALALAGCGGTLALGVDAHLTASGNLKATLDTWGKFAAATGGIALASEGASDVPELMQQINREGMPPGEPVDLVYVVDTTASMGDDIAAARDQMRTILADLTARNPDRQVGIVAYRDRGDDYVSRTFLELEVDDARIQEGIAALEVGGGGDMREHVYAGLDEALRTQPWRPGASRHIVLIGDAPPHDDYSDDPRTYDSVVALASQPERNVHIHSIGIKCDMLCRALIGAGL
jgi:Mg-chelatase subunit ChlD